MFCIRQNEQLEADRQVDDPKTQDASSNCQAYQAGAETNHNFCTNNSWYGDPQAFLLFSELVPWSVQVVNWNCARGIVLYSASRQESWEDSELFKPQPSSDVDALGKKRYIGECSGSENWVEKMFLGSRNRTTKPSMPPSTFHVN